MRTYLLLTTAALALSVVACDTEDKQVASDNGADAAAGTSGSGGAQGGNAGAGGTSAKGGSAGSTGGSGGATGGSGGATGGSGGATGGSGGATGGSGGATGGSGGATGGSGGATGGSGGSAGACQTTGTFGPVNLLTPADHAYALTLSDDSVFWISFGASGSLKKIAKTGGSIQVLASNLVAPINVRSDASYVYWLDSGNYPQQVSRIPLAGGQVQVLNPSPLPSTGVALAVTATTVFAGDDSIFQVPINGGTATTFLQMIPSMWVLDMAADTTHLVWSSWMDPNQGNGPNKVYAMPLSGGVPVELDSFATAKPGGVMTDGTDVYFLEYGTSVRKVSKAGGAATVLANAPVATATPAMDGTHVYFAQGPTNGCWSIHRVPKAGGAVETVGTGLADDGSQGFAQGANMAADDHHVYFALPAGGIYQVPTK